MKDHRHCPGIYCMGSITRNMDSKPIHIYSTTVATTATNFEVLVSFHLKLKLNKILGFGRGRCSRAQGSSYLNHHWDLRKKGQDICPLSYSQPGMLPTYWVLYQFLDTVGTCSMTGPIRIPSGHSCPYTVISYLQVYGLVTVPQSTWI